LDAETAQLKRTEMIGVILDSIKQVKELEKGYGLRFGPKDEDLLLVTDWIYIERYCNPFLRFTFRSESNRGPIWVDVSGPDGTKELLKSDYALNRWL
jgi:hypothetical protein